MSNNILPVVDKSIEQPQFGETRSNSDQIDDSPSVLAWTSCKSIQSELNFFSKLKSNPASTRLKL